MTRAFNIVLLYSFVLSGWLATAAQGDENAASRASSATNVSTYGDNSTIVEDDPAERAAYAAIAAMINGADQRRRREMAERFLADYPRSWRLSAVYEIAAKASIALGDLRAALDFGARSLHILPENPFLLLPLADVQLKSGLYEAANRSAQDAVWCLDRFDHPAAIDERSWPQLKTRLEAEAYVDIGRAAAAQGLASKGEARDRRLAEAEMASLRALSFDGNDRGAALLLGMVYQAEARASDAAAAFAYASRADGPLRPQALDRLRALHSNETLSHGLAFEEWIASLRLALPKPQDAAAPGTSRNRSYAGSESCSACHASQHAAWQLTGMGRMLRPYRASDIIGDFTSGQAILDDAGNPAARAVLQSGRHYLEIREGAGWSGYPVEYVIGSKWQQAYATRLASGEIQVFPLQYNQLEKRWVNYWKIIDEAGSPRSQITRFGQVEPAATYQLECAPCHTSQERFASGAMEATAASFREGGINCEMCHGPSAEHAAAMRAGRSYRKGPAEPPVDFQHISATEYVAICSQCHMQSGKRFPELGGAMNYSEASEKFYRTIASRPFIDYSRKAFYRDGRFRETVFIVESFVRSACFRRGGATCGNCHDPHPSDPANNPVSLKFGADSDRMCLGCHTQFQARPEAHTRHPAPSEGSRCVSCHMPRIMNALLFQARSHQIDDIPDAEAMARFGPAESPNACLMCHRDRDAAWLSAQLKTWKQR